ncbi:MAG TPA: hypothetical protein PLM07_06855 [Candidatus Rifleibacterium sp.]|nr:hypothetical protein [Candidatus Rifleibacterium sp.]HPT45601.1 hypothetical protein [Candidatus Rifleibacterium sp.]
MNCEKCALNIDSKSFRGNLFRQIPLEAKAIFICNSQLNIDSRHRTLNQSRNLCARDLWVLTFIGRRDPYAQQHAPDTLDNLVAGGHAELLCSLFESAPYETRRELWLRMTRCYPERLYMFDALFERECLAPVEGNELPAGLHVYQYQMLFGSHASQPVIDDL